MLRSAAQTPDQRRLGCSRACPSPIWGAVLAVDTLLYLLLAWYLDQVVPSEFGLQRPPWFLCTPAYWLGGERHAHRLRVGAAEAGLALEDRATEPLEAAAATGAAGTDSAAAAAVVVEPLPELPAEEAGFGVRTARLRKVKGPPTRHHRPTLPAAKCTLPAVVGGQVWPRGVAVQGLDLEMRRGQITALLGANGAAAACECRPPRLTARIPLPA